MEGLLPADLERTGLDPAAPPGGSPERRWWGRHLAEVRWQAELARLLADPIYRGHGVTRGDGAPVLLVPGFLAGDGSLLVMRQWLDRMGYRPFSSGIVVNVDCSNRALRRLDERLEEVHAETGRPVTLIGHSRGAHFAKALAHWRPERTASVISIGAGLDTPFDISVPTKAAVAAVRAVHGRLDRRLADQGCLTDACGCAFSRHYGAPFPADIPLTSIYTREDGVVWWEACVVPYARNVEVTGSHVGLAFNRKVYAVIADALAAVPAAA
jgi:pimeloyl-ACP methyl ester carboxylesterase